MNVPLNIRSVLMLLRETLETLTLRFVRRFTSAKSTTIWVTTLKR